MPKYTISITCNDETRKLILGRSGGESERHLSMKLMAYLIYFDRQPRIEVSVGQHYKPDLVCEELDGTISLWVECGDISVHKLDKISTTNHNAQIIVVKPTERTLRGYKRQADKRVRRRERVRYLAFEDGFIERFVSALSTRSQLAVQIPPSHPNHPPPALSLALNGTEIDCRMVWVEGD